VSYSYEGPETGINGSWSSDITTAWEERDFDLEADDESTSQTVGGTTDDDLGEVTTTFLPATVDTDEVTDTQRRILTAAVMRRDASRYELSATTNASPQYVADVCGRWLPDHPAAATTADDETRAETTQTTLDAWSGGDLDE
jgi:hypothetical protein